MDISHSNFHRYMSAIVIRFSTECVDLVFEFTACVVDLSIINL